MMKNIVASMLLFLLLTKIKGQEDSTFFKSSVQELMNLPTAEKGIKDALNVDITSASKKEESLLQSPVTIKVITAEEIRRRGYNDLEQLFHDISGFDVSRGNGNDYSTIFPRGYRSNNIDRFLMLVDGIEENDLWRGNIWLSRQYPISNIDRIEIIYGAASTIYGANAFCGVINVITKEPNKMVKKGKKWGFSAHNSIGSWNTYLTDMTVATQHKDISFKLTARYFRSDEADKSMFPDYDFDLEKGDVNTYDQAFYLQRLTVRKSSGDFTTLANLLRTNPTRYQPFMGFNKDSSAIVPTSFAADYAKSLDKRVMDSIRTSGGGGIRPDYAEDWFIYGKLKIGNFTFGFQKWKRNEGQSGWYPEIKVFPNPQSMPWSPDFTSFYANYSQVISPTLSINMLNNFREHELMDIKNANFRSYGRGSIRLRDLINHRIPFSDYRGYYVISKQFRSETRLLYVPSEKISVITGFEVRNSLIQGDYVIGGGDYPQETGAVNTSFPAGNHFDSYNLALFSQATYKPIPALSLVAGLRTDYNRIRKTGGFGWAFNPRFAVVYTTEKFTAKAIYAEAFKDADFWQRYATAEVRRLNNPTLEPEKVRNFDLNFSYYPNKYWFFNAVFYQAHYSGAVGSAVVPFPGGGTTTQNQAVGEYLIRGAQAEAIFKYNNYYFGLNYTYCDPRNTKDLLGNEQDIRIGDIASHRINLEGNWEYKKFNANLRLNYVGERLTGKKTTISDNPLEKVDAYLVANTALSYRDLAVKGLTLQLIVSNLFNSTYYVPGLRTADGIEYSARIPQDLRGFTLKMVWDW